MRMIKMNHYFCQKIKQDSFTQRIPTDKYGQSYRGPKTYKSAMARINDLVEDGMEFPSAAKSTIELLEDHGYTGVAKRIRKQISE